MQISSVDIGIGTRTGSGPGCPITPTARKAHALTDCGIIHQGVRRARVEHDPDEHPTVMEAVQRIVPPPPPEQVAVPTVHTDDGPSPWLCD